MPFGRIPNYKLTYTALIQTNHSDHSELRLVEKNKRGKKSTHYLWVCAIFLVYSSKIKSPSSIIGADSYVYAQAYCWKHKIHMLDSGTL